MFSWGEDSQKGFRLRDGSYLHNETADGLHFLNLSHHITDLCVSHRVLAFLESNGNSFIIRTIEGTDGSRVRGKQKFVKCHEKIQAVSCGDDLVTLLTDKGDVLCVDTAHTYVPRAPEALRNIAVSQIASLPLVQIAAGGEQSFALTLSGGVFGWGRNHRGQLGLGDTTDRPTPTPVHHLNVKKTVHVSCGKDHTAILTKDGAVFTFGSGQYGQLGNNSFNDELRPQLVALGEKVTKIACGRHHTLVLTDSRIVYSFGCGEQGQLGHGDKSNSSVPLPVQLPQDTADDCTIRNIFAGGNCSFATCTSTEEVHEESNTASVSSVTQHCLDGMFDKWTSECDSVSWKKIKREDKHFQTSPKCCGLNLSHARLAIKKLAKKDKVLAEKHKHSTKLAEAVAAAVLNLSADSLQVIGDWWSSLSHSTMVRHVKVWKKALSEILSSQPVPRNSGVRNLLLVLQYMYNFETEFLKLQDWIVEPGCIRLKDLRVELHLRQASVLEDTFEQLSPAHHSDYKMPLVVIFDENPEIDMVHVKDFFYEVFHEMVSPKSGMFMFIDSLAWLPSKFHWDETEVDLDPQHPGKSVTNQNKKEFVDACVNHAFNTSVEGVFQEFKRGFFKVCDRDLVKLFRPEELKEVLVSKYFHDWAKLKQNTVYEGQLHVDHPTVQMFWEVFDDELTEDDKKAFLSLSVSQSHCTNMFSWGEDCTQCFHFKDGTDSSTADGLHFIKLSNHITDLSEGHSVLAFVRNDGKSFIIRTNESKDGTRVRGKRKCVDYRARIQAVSCGDDLVTLLTDRGDVLCVDTAHTYVPRGFERNIAVSQVACGSQHSVALSKALLVQHVALCPAVFSLDFPSDGQVYTWGQDSRGQLGLGKRKLGANSPEHLRSLSALPLVQIAAGGEQSFALTLSLEACSAGAETTVDSSGWETQQVNVIFLRRQTHTNSCSSPEHEENCPRFLWKGPHGHFDKVVWLLPQDGAVFTFGSGQYGQLGNNSFNDELRPQLVALGEKVTKIACGRHHTLVLTDSRIVYSFGCGEQGQLGHGDKSNSSVPLPVQLPQDTADDCTIRNIFAGGNCSFATCTSTEVPTETQTVQAMKVVGLNIFANGQIKNIYEEETVLLQHARLLREIHSMFSSASFWNKSFLEQSEDKHFQTSPKCCGLNLSHARLAIKKLAKKDKVLAEVESAVLHLLPSLEKNPVGVEGLRIFLLLNELLHVIQKHKHSTKLAEAVAAAVLNLSADSLQVIGDWWSSLSHSTMVRHVKVWKKALSEILSSQPVPRNSGVRNLLLVLQYMYNANSRIAEPQRLPESDFHLLFDEKFLHEDVQHWRLWSQHKNGHAEPLILCSFPFVMDLQTKTMVFDRNTVFTQFETGFLKLQDWIVEPGCIRLKDLRVELHLRQASVLEDTFEQLSPAHHSDYKMPLVVIFDENPEIDMVHVKDFFYEVFHEMVSPKSGMFMFIDSLAWLPSKATPEDQRYFYFGVLCGLALYNKCIIHLPFPLALFKKLLGVKPSLEDMMEFNTVVGKSLQSILEEDDTESLGLVFFFHWDETEVDLDPQHPGKSVTNQNKKEFVDACVNHAFNTSVEGVFQEFKRGFFKVCDRDLVKLFRPEELKEVLVSKYFHDWAKLKQNTVYEGQLHVDHPTVQMFWEVFDDELTEDDKKAFLYGQVYTWGQDSRGQLGLGKRKLGANSPQHLRSLSALPLVQIAAGGEQSFALSLSGGVFGWGRNHRGQLGLGDTTDRPTPTPVHHLNMKKTVHVSCGKDHTAILTKDGAVFTFGSGQYGQLGNNSFNDELRPQLVALGEKVTKIACGRHHTLVLTDSRIVYSFGCGEQGQLGHGDKSNSSVPLPVQLPQDTADDCTIRNIFAGGNCSFATCTSTEEVHEESNTASVSSVTQHCLDGMFDKWTSECDSVSWKKIKREDKHFQTSPKCCGLNLSHARLAIKKLAKKDKVLAEKHKHSTKLAEAVAAAVLNLSADSLQVIGDWWSSLSHSTMVRHVKVWKKALSEILSSQPVPRNSGVRNLLLVLQYMYNVIFDENPEIDMVHVKDFFYEVFHEMVSPKSGMFMFIDSLAWLPSKFHWDETEVDLDPQHPGKSVTNQNKKEFVDACVNHAFNTSVEGVFQEFKRGFFKVCDRDLVKLFRPEELKEVLVSKYFHDWAKLKQNTVYEGQLHVDHPTVQMFWEVFDDELTEDDKKAFL
ncbi:hypothetical protein L3Q82_024235 [Scortum barcoo]|uniref:Uncharacterized protein n=1 Tax=Scortum barcoo TaxID=214431 RepID=A0ACB8WV41_9TELE|nr:hypothetical protein L3Q82_024235 [Scortum barcoo]